MELKYQSRENGMMQNSDKKKISPIKPRKGDFNSNF